VARPSAHDTISSSWRGHFAGGPGTNPDDVKFIDDQLKILLGN
jgi:homoserine O-acetyltransferase